MSLTTLPAVTLETLDAQQLVENLEVSVFRCPARSTGPGIVGFDDELGK